MATKVMYLIDYYASQGGTEGQLLMTLRSLDRTRYSPELTTLQSTNYLDTNPPPCKVNVLGVRKLVSLRSVFRMLRFSVRMRREGFALVHCFFNDSSLIAPPLLWLFGVRSVVSRRDMGFWQTRGTLRASRFVSRFVDRYVVNSLAVKMWVHQQERVPENKIEVIYNGYSPIEADREDGPGWPAECRPVSGRRVIGVVANVKPVKRLDTLLDAFALIAHRWPDAVVVIVGNDFPTASGGSVTGELQLRAERHGIADRVIFTGGVVNPARYVRHFDVAVLCSESEGFSNAIIEYMAASRPVLCTNAGGNAEIVRDGVNGYLVPVGDAGALAARLSELLDDRALARRMGDAGRELVMTSYSEARMIDQQMACYDEVLSESSWGRRKTAISGACER